MRLENRIRDYFRARDVRVAKGLEVEEHVTARLLREAELALRTRSTEAENSLSALRDELGWLSQHTTPVGGYRVMANVVRKNVERLLARLGELLTEGDI